MRGPDEKPPRWAERALARMLPPRDRRPVVDELCELYQRKRATRSRASAARWYVIQVIGFAWRIVRHGRSRDGRGWRMGTESRRRGSRERADEWARDVRYATRSLRRTPGFSLSAVAVLALGIGATTAVSSTVRSVLLEPLPYPEPDRLVRVWAASPERGNLRDDVSYPNFVDWSERTRALSSMAAYTTFPGDWALSLEGRADEELSTAWVAGDFFGTMGVPPLFGRAFDHEDIEERRPLLMLSEGAWRRLFGADSAVVGRTVTFNYKPFEVVGVMPAGFAYPEPDLEAWVPLTTFDLAAFPYDRRGIRFAWMVGRLADGRSIEDVRADLGGVASELEALYPDDNGGQNAATVIPLRDFVVGDVERALWSVLGAVGFFLLLAAANVANLFVARGLARRHELALRRSLGASSGRIARGVLTESTIVAFVGGLLGLGVAAVLLRAITTQAVRILPRSAEIAMDVPTVVTALVMGFLVAALAGAWPAVRAAGGLMESGLKAGPRAIGSEIRGVRARHTLVTAEVGVAVMLLVGAGLLVRSFGELVRTDPGFVPEGAAAMTINVPFSRYSAAGAWATRHEEILTALRSVPTIDAVGAIGYLPIRSQGEGIAVDVPGIYEMPPGEGIVPRVFPVTRGAFGALGMTLVEGRDFLASDGPTDLRVAVVNEAFVRDILGGREAVGQRFANGSTGWEIVGVVADVRHNGLREAAPVSFYTHMPQGPRARQSYVVRGGGDPSTLFETMRAAVESVDPSLGISEMLPLSSVTEEARAFPRLVAGVLTGFAGSALLLAALGVYGILAYVVRGRLKEMGLRAALGASRAEIARLVILGGMRPALLGLVVGLAGAAALSGSLRGLLFGVAPLDAWTFVAGGTLLLVTAVAACSIPALWAVRVDPAESLRAE